MATSIQEWCRGSTGGYTTQNVKTYPEWNLVMRIRSPGSGSRDTQLSGSRAARPAGCVRWGL